MKMFSKTLLSLFAVVVMLTGSSTAFADKLDDVIDAGVLRCGVVLDFPPIGYRDANNEPAGFDVEYCKDLAAALEVDYEIIAVTWAERLPLIVTNRGDVVFGGTSELYPVLRQLALQYLMQFTMLRLLLELIVALLLLKICTTKKLLQLLEPSLNRNG